MLVLSRSKGEQIVVNGDIRFTVVDVRGEKVRIGIDAPKDVVVERAEFFDRVAVPRHRFSKCFLSYSSTDDEFATKLYERLEALGIDVWFAPQNMKGGRKIHEQIQEALSGSDKVLLVLSEGSIRSPWVRNELRWAVQQEVAERVQKLFPIRLMPLQQVQEWTYIDSNTGVDIASELREYHIVDFSDWRDSNGFEKVFKNVVDALRLET